MPGKPTPAWSAATLGIHADMPSLHAEQPAGLHGAPGPRVPWSHNQDIAPPIGVTTTFESAEGGPVYARISNPTRDRCECVLAALEAAPGAPTPHALLYGSGLAAASAILVALLPDVKRIAISGGYHGTHLILDTLKTLRPSFEVIELPPSVEEAAASLREGDLVWLESPRNPECQVFDIAGFAGLACKPKVVVDGTFAPPPLQRPLALGATAVMHATTKCAARPLLAAGCCRCCRCCRCWLLAAGCWLPAAGCWLLPLLPLLPRSAAPPTRAGCPSANHFSPRLAAYTHPRCAGAHRPGRPQRCDGGRALRR
jgi:hypothetical protein